MGRRTLGLGLARETRSESVRILPATMRAVELTVTDLGIVLGTYEPAGAVRHRQM